MPSTVTVDAQLRDMLQTARKLHRLSRRAVADETGYSVSYWRQIESGSIATVPASTLAIMLQAVGVLPTHLHDRGYGAVAEAMVAQRALHRPDAGPFENAAERHLWETPGLDETTRMALITYLRTLQQVQATGREEPFSDELWQRRRDQD